MNHDYDKIEEDLKEQTGEHRRKGKHKISGRSVFKLQEIIKEKSGKKKDGQDGTSPETLARDN